MSVGKNWLRQAERAAAGRGRQLLQRAEGELLRLLPGARIERNGSELRVGAARLLRRWMTEPALRFFMWSLK
ncbi:MAG: hypothetical protein ABIN83_01015 [Sphingomicrobium sp.]